MGLIKVQLYTETYSRKQNGKSRQFEQEARLGD